MRHFKFLFLLGLLSLAPVQSSFAGEWVVDRISGRAWALEVGKDPVRLTVDMAVPEGVTVETSRNGRVRLVGDNNVMSLAPSTVAVVAPSRSNRKTRVIQQVGSIEFDVEKRRRPHFLVETPYMAAVVKGTTFTVDVSKSTTSIDVSSGLVQVSDLRSGEKAAIGAGQSASVAASSAGLETAGKNAPGVRPGKPAPSAVAPLGRDLADFKADGRTGPKSDTNKGNGREKGEAKGNRAESRSGGGNGKK